MFDRRLEVHRVILAVCAVALVVATGAAGKNAPFVGVWKGTVKTPAGASTQVVVTLTSSLGAC